MKEKKHCKWYNDEFCTNDKSPCVADYCPVVEYPELCNCREVDKDINVRSKTTDEAVNATVKSLKWVCNQIPNDLGDSNEEKMLKCIQLYCEQAISIIHRLQSENERLTSLYDGKTGFMTSSIGDLPLTVEGLRKAVDEISRLLGVQGELQELNAKYYNETKDLRRGNDELQKQVDELREANIDLWNANQAGVKLDGKYKRISEDVKQQIGKDTAKEILQRGKYCMPSGLKEWICERYGVEVE